MTINITFEGNLTEDPSLRFTPSGAAVANFTVAHTPRRFDKQANEWKDEETIFLRCSVWRDQAEHVAESLFRGTAVIVSGKLGARSWEAKDGTKRTDLEVTVDSIGPSLARATAQVRKSERRAGNDTPAHEGRVIQPGTDDPWATQPANAGNSGWGNPITPEPPF